MNKYILSKKLPKVGNYIKEEGRYYKILRISIAGKGVKYAHTKSFKMPFIKNFQSENYELQNNNK